MPRGWEKTESGFRVDYFNEELEELVRINQMFHGWGVTVADSKGVVIKLRENVTKKVAMAAAMRYMKARTPSKIKKMPKKKLVSKRVKKVKRMKFL